MAPAGRGHQGRGARMCWVLGRDVAPGGRQQRGSHGVVACMPCTMINKGKRERETRETRGG